ncbi:MULTISPECIES: hypothetical protein [unclassified Methanosarcina]|nr:MULTISPECIES: hypothetical protein [unclassified Methanosarcina]
MTHENTSRVNNRTHKNTFRVNNRKHGGTLPEVVSGRLKGKCTE